MTTRIISREPAAAMDWVQELEWLAWVETPTGEYPLAKVFILGNLLRIFTDPDGQVILSEQAEFTSDPVIARRQVTLHTAAGDYVIHRSGNCGCGRTIKHFNPRTWPD